MQLSLCTDSFPTSPVVITARAGHKEMLYINELHETVAEMQLLHHTSVPASPIAAPCEGSVLMRQ